MKLRTDITRELTLFSLYPTSADVSYPQYRIFRPEGYPMDQIFLVSGGNGVIRISDEVYPLEVGDMFYVRAGVSHEYYGTDSFATTYISYAGEGVGGIRDYYALGDFKLYTGKSQTAFERNVKKIFEKFDSIKDIPTLCALTYSTVIGFFEENCRKEYSSIEEVYYYIEANYASQLTLDDILGFYPYSKAKLCREFREKYNMTVFDKIIETRLLRAKSILTAQPDVKLKTVADSCGFADVSYFCKLYRKTFGASPKAK